MRNTLWWAIGGFVVYELVAWKVNDSRAAAARGGGSYTPVPFDLIGKYVGYPGAGLGPEIPAIPVTRPTPISFAVRGDAFNSVTYPGVASMQAQPYTFDPMNPLGL